jgi:hypothetical protein
MKLARLKKAVRVFGGNSSRKDELVGTLWR